MPWLPRFLFRGRIERDETRVYAICEEAGVATHGNTEDEALHRMRAALDVYFKTICEQGQLEAAIKAGKLHIEVPQKKPFSRNVLHIERDNDTFEATLASAG